MILVFSVAIAINTSSTTYQSLRYSEVKELIGNTNEDFQRALRNMLACATQEYDQTPNINSSLEHALGNVTYWMKTAIRTLALKGVQINFTVDQNSLKLDLYSLLRGTSSISTNYTMDIPSLGFYGWKENVLLLLNMTIISIFNDTSPKDNLGTGINIMVNREGGIPVEDLLTSNFQVQYFNLSTHNWQEGNNTIFNYGGGNYTIYLGDLGSSSGYIIVKLQDIRGIIVKCFRSFLPIIETQLSNNSIHVNETVYDTANVRFPGFVIPLFYPVPTGSISFSVRYPNGTWLPLGTVTVNWDNNTNQLYANSPNFTPTTVQGASDIYRFNATYSGDSFYPSTTSDITDVNERLTVSKKP